jgi:hypothetical protein
MTHPLAPPAGTNFYLGVDYAANEFVQDIGGAVDALPAPFTIGTIRAWFIQGWDATPRVLLDQPLVFSFGTDDGGRVPFYVTGDAAPPGDATDGKRYVAGAPGTFGGSAFATGDIVEFYAGVTLIMVTKAEQVDVEQAIIDYLALNPPVSLLMRAKQERVCYGVRNSAPPNGFASMVGVAVIVGPVPSGDFSTFTPWDVVVFDGTEWVPFDPDAFLGTRFTLVDSANNTYPGAEIVRVGVSGDGAPRDNYDSAAMGHILGTTTSLFSGSSVPYPDVLANGWIIQPPRIGVLTSGYNAYPPPALYDNDPLYVGGPELQILRLGTSGSMALNVQSRTVWAGSIPDEPAAAFSIVELFNDSLTPTTVSFYGNITPAIAHFAPYQTRRFWFVRRSGGAGGFSMVPMDAVYHATAVALAPWQQPVATQDRLTFLIAGDEVELRGSLEYFGGPPITGALLAPGATPAEAVPSAPIYFPAVVNDSGSGTLSVAPMMLATDGSLTWPTSPLTSPGATVSFAFKYNRRGAI